MLTADERKARKRARNLAHYRANRERILVQQRAYQVENRQRRAAVAKAYRERTLDRRREQERVRRRTKPEQVRAADRRYRLRTYYGLSVSDYQRILARQGGHCAICGRPPGRMDLCVDHDHRSGAIRELLCNRCNTAISLLRESPAVMRRAIRYMEQPELLPAHSTPVVP
jgi:hypothetical protein